MLTGICGCGKPPADSTGDADTDTDYTENIENKKPDAQNESKNATEKSAENDGGKAASQTAGSDESADKAQNEHGADDSDGIVTDTKTNGSYYE